MKDKKMRSIILLLISFFLLLACTEEKIVTVEVIKENSWIEVKGLRYKDKITLSSGSYENSLYFQHPNYFTEISQNKIKKSFNLDMPDNFDFKLPISQGIIVCPYSLLFPIPDTDILVTNLKADDEKNLLINLKEIDSSFKNVVSPFYSKWMAINKKRQILLQYSSNTQNDEVKLMLLNIATKNEQDPVKNIALTGSKTISIKIDRLDDTKNPIFMIAIDDYFLVQWKERNFYKIYSDGSFKKLESNENFEVIKYNNDIIAYSYYKLYISKDNGENWQPLAVLNNFSYDVDFYNIQDSLIYTYMDKIYTMSFQNDLVYSRELKNDGLEDRYISGIEVLYDTVYVATYAGIFKKSINKFFESKINN
ncbi:MAG TPA: hypothetical protein PKY56_06690 [Candidatus Kapabacteria bacterium]|nr:hypothetical protein [Candidatus Kapabacteria bacterium]HPO62246.1 hypothetical protein [Candidatus Kapabacteria bacterium]